MINDDMNAAFALAYVGLAAPAIAVQLALACGAPWGVLTLGGKWPGRLPRAVRCVSFVQAIILIVMTYAVLSRGGLISSDVHAMAYPIAMVLTGFTFISNTATPSRPERRLWMPITAGMFVAGLLTGYA